MLSRNITNTLRFILDQLIPPILRDNKYLIYPLFFIWYKGKNVKKLMEFKSVVHQLDHQEFCHYYEIYDSLPQRETDLASGSIDFIFEQLKGEEHASIIDIGHGSAYLLNLLAQRGYKNLAGFDMHLPKNPIPEISFHAGNAEELPFPDKSFDITLCNHMLEHVLDVEKTISELKRITRRKLIITLPCQRYNQYTFELHINFFPQESCVHRAIKIPGAKCQKIDGDWSYVANL